MAICKDSILPEKDRRSAFREIITGLGNLLAPKERLNIWQWAERYRYLAKGVSAKTLEGPKLYNSSLAPHQRKPQEAFTDPKVQVVVMIGASQVMGKTEIFSNVLGYHMHHEPRSAIIMYPTIEAAEKFSKKKFTPNVDASPVLAELIKPARSRDSGNTILSKEFRGGSIYFIGANSAPSLRGASGPVVLGDEIDSNQSSAGQEGDPVELLFKRAESFPNAVKGLASTPTVKGLSAIWEWWEDSDQEFWFVPCPKCGEFQRLTWAQVVWPKGDPDNTSLLCIKCAAALSDKQRVEMYYSGEWRPTAPFKGVAAFHLNGIYTPWPAQKGFSNRLEQMAKEHIRAVKKGEFALRVWTNTFLCELWEEQTEKIDSAELYGRAESYTPQTLPEQVILIMASVDVQKAFIELEVIGLGADDETWGIEHRKIEGDTEQGEVWSDLGNQLAKAYKRTDGVELRISATTIDMRHKPDKVRNFVRKSGIPRVFPVYGINSAHQPILVTARFDKFNRLRRYAVAGRIAKDMLFARLKVDEPGPRYMHFPKGQGYTSDYFEGLTSEVLKRKKVRGKIEEIYEKVSPSARNEPLDIRVYFLAGIDILKPNLTAIARNLKPETTKNGDNPDKIEVIVNRTGTEIQRRPTAPITSGPARQKLKLGGF